jgi:hypothetical protein
MSHIQYIKNVTAIASFSDAPGTFSHTVNNMPTPNPDEIIIRAITWSGAVNDRLLYLVWCNLNNGYIGSFSGENVGGNQLNITIHVNSMVPNVIDFKLYSPLPGGGVDLVDNIVTGDIAIHMDFIKYRSVPSHA